MEASGWAASAACSHHPTARVGHSRRFFCHFDFIRWTRTFKRRQDSIVLWTGIVTSGRASTAGTIITTTRVYMANHMEETMVRTTWRPWKFTSVKEMSTPYQLKQQLYWDNVEEGPVRSFRTSGIACGPPSRGGVNMQSVGKATC
jgi:hypothetical protein